MESDQDYDALSWFNSCVGKEEMKKQNRETNEDQKQRERLKKLQKHIAKQRQTTANRGNRSREETNLAKWTILLILMTKLITMQY